mgnify:CR=1 FL=1
MYAREAPLKLAFQVNRLCDTGMKTTSQRKVTKMRRERKAQQQRNTDNNGNDKDHCGYLCLSVLFPL